MKATFSGQLIAESDDTVVVEGNHYFPADSVRMEHLSPNGDTYVCPWKGQADYFDVTAEGRTAEGAAWVYPEPKPAASQIAGRFAFWRGVEVSQ
jgi:uncharacterized protein (DUF427 family)